MPPARRGSRSASGINIGKLYKNPLGRDPGRAFSVLQGPALLQVSGDRFIDLRASVRPGEVVDVPILQ